MTDPKDFKYEPYKVTERLQQAKRDWSRSIHGHYIPRMFRAFKWRYDHNPVFKDLIDLVWATLAIGIACIFALLVFIIQFFF